MKKIDKDIDNILSLQSKQQILKELQQEDLLELFKTKYVKSIYTPPKLRKTPLDQHIAIAINKEEKELLKSTLLEIKKAGPGISISSYIRNQSVLPIDLEVWKDRALEGLQKLATDDYNKDALMKKRRQYIKMIDHADDDAEEDLFFYRKKLQEVDNRLAEVTKKSSKRTFKLNGRVTFQEASDIRWKAARLSLSVADYLRFLIFGYEPFSIADNHLSVDSRKRFYISILDIHNTGWGQPPQQETCPNCLRYMKEVQILKEQLARFQKLKK